MEGDDKNKYQEADQELEVRLEFLLKCDGEDIAEAHREQFDFSG